MNRKAKRNALIICSVLVRILPLIIAFAYNWEKWVVARGEKAMISTGMSLSVGGILCVVLVVLSMIDKLPKPNGLVGAVIFFTIVTLLEPLIIDLKLLSGMYLVGIAGDYIFFHYPIKKLNKQISDEATAGETMRQFKMYEESKKKGE